MMEIAGLAALVTGGILGLGGATAALLSQRGARVTLLAVNDPMRDGKTIRFDGGIRIAPR